MAVIGNFAAYPEGSAIGLVTGSGARDVFRYTRFTPAPDAGPTPSRDRSRLRGMPTARLTPRS